MAWSPVNEVLAYIAPSVNAPVYYGPLHTLDAATGEDQTLVDDLVVAFFWSPDGRYIAYLTIVDEEDNAVQAALPGKVGQTSKPGAQADDPLLMAVWVYDTQDGSIRRLRSFEPTDLFVFQFLPFFDQYSRSHRVWSSDSQNLVLPIVEATGPKITVIPVDGRPSEPIVSGVMGFWNR
jgi:TolB protein